MVEAQLPFFDKEKRVAWKKHLGSLKALRSGALSVCSECNGAGRLYARGMCHSCYNKAYAKTERGKAARRRAIKSYRESFKGRQKTREANKRYKQRVRQESEVR